ncbi:MAG: prephenate dehydrogenase [Marinilabiliaceae bacterium]|nr:prephenate dehydrogenase [Marinilabiliaceae bacterium]
MRICIVGAGKMGTILSDSLCLQHEVAIYDREVQRLQYVFNTRRLMSLDEIKDFNPELLINAVTLKYTISTFEEVLPYLSPRCMISDIASVKTGLKEFYANAGHPYVSTHPMFGPTFANLRDLRRNHAIIIAEGDHLGKVFFKDFYSTLGLNIHEYTFQGHDETIAYSLSIPFVSSMVFAACMKPQDAPGTTFSKHFDVAKGVLSEDDFLLSEILFNPYTPEQVERIHEQLGLLLDIIKAKDSAKMKSFLSQLRENIAK